MHRGRPEVRVARGNGLTLAAALIALAAARPALSQTFGGRLLDKTTGLPLRAVTVGLFDSTAKLVSKTQTDTLGTFYVDAPGPGSFKLAFAMESISLGESGVVTIAAGDFVQKDFSIDLPREREYVAREVGKQVVPAGNNRAPKFPEELRKANISGEVLAQFVVDTLGRADMKTFKVLRPSRPEFVAAVRESLPSMRFSPAELGGRKVRQLVQMPFQFNLTGGPREP